MVEQLLSDLWLRGHGFESHPLHYRVWLWISLSRTRSLDTKQYSSVLVERRWCSEAYILEANCSSGSTLANSLQILSYINFMSSKVYERDKHLHTILWTMTLFYCTLLLSTVWLPSTHFMMYKCLHSVMPGYLSQFPVLKDVRSIFKLVWWLGKVVISFLNIENENVAYNFLCVIEKQ